MIKTQFDFLNLFRIRVGGNYHALDKTIQICFKCIKSYSEAENDKERDEHWYFAQKVAELTETPFETSINRWKEN